MGENVAGPVAKACDEPDRLTTEEMFVLDRYYMDVLNNVRETLNASKVSEDLTVGEWKQWTTPNFNRIFATEYGRWWFQTSNWLEPELKKAGRDFLASQEIEGCSERYDRYRNRSK